MKSIRPGFCSLLRNVIPLHLPAAFIRGTGIPHLGHGVEKVKVDVCWGGMYYVMADVNQFPWVELTPDQGREITRISSLILKAAQDQLPVANPDYPGVGITISQLFKFVDEED